MATGIKFVMRKYLLILASALFIKTSLFSAIFTIENYTGSTIDVELHLNKTFGSKIKVATIISGEYYTFDTGIWKVLPGGIAWRSNDEFYCLDSVFIDNSFMLGGVIRLFKTGTYEFKFSDGRSGYGYIKKIQ